MATVRKHNFHSSPPLRLYRNDSLEFEDSPPLLSELPSQRATLGDFIYPDVASRQACFWGGSVFALIGTLEAIYPEITGLQASRYHGLFYLVAGGLLVIPAVSLSPRWLSKISIALGLLFAAIGFAGFFVGAPEYGDRFYWALSAGNLEFGTKDHILQEAIGAMLIVLGLHSSRKEENSFSGRGSLHTSFR